MSIFGSVLKKIRYPIIQDKRQRFAVQTVILTLFILTTQLVWQDVRFNLVIFLGVLSYILTIWSLYEDIKKVEWLLLFILPVSFTISVSLFYFLLPGRMITRVIITSIFAIGTYAILLVENIYNVAAIRSIQLIRAAQSIGLLMTLVVMFLFSNIFYSLRLAYWMNGILQFLVAFILALQSLWSMRLETCLTRELISYSLLVAIGVGQIGLALSFWPVENASYSLLITGAYYALVSILQHSFMGRLFINTVQEYIIVFIFTFFLALFTTSWG